jgi:hypothetical protein
MVDRCPRCGHQFVRRVSDAFFLGGYLINLCLGLLLLGACLIGYGMSVTESIPGSATPWLVGCVASVFVPLLAYPSSKTTWAALDLILHPPEEQELLEGLRFVADGVRGSG